MRGRTLAIALLAIAAVAGPAAGEAEARFSVTPTLIHLDRQRGEVASGAFDVKLGAEEGRAFEVKVQDIVQQPGGATSFEPPTNSEFSASNWVTVTPPRFSGEPNRTQPVEFTVQVPSKAAPGDHITSLTVTRLPEKSDAIAESVQAVSVRLTVHVFGKARPRAEITSFDAPGFSGGSPVEVSATVENTGNVTLDFDGKRSGEIAIVQDDEHKATEELTGELYPGQSRDFELAWNDPPLFGRFQAEMTLDAGGEPLTESKSVLQVPWRQIGALILVVLAITILVAGRRRGRF